jgi:hypothetical protein
MDFTSVGHNDDGTWAVPSTVVTHTSLYKTFNKAKSTATHDNGRRLNSFCFCTDCLAYIYTLQNSRNRLHLIEPWISLPYKHTNNLRNHCLQTYVWDGRENSKITLSSRVVSHHCFRSSKSKTNMQRISMVITLWCYSQSIRLSCPSSWIAGTSCHNWAPLASSTLEDGGVDKPTIIWQNLWANNRLYKGLCPEFIPHFLKWWEHSGMMLPSNIDTDWTFPILSFWVDTVSSLRVAILCTNCLQKYKHLPYKLHRLPLQVCPSKTQQPVKALPPLLTSLETLLYTMHQNLHLAIYMS